MPNWSLGFCNEWMNHFLYTNPWLWPRAMQRLFFFLLFLLLLFFGVGGMFFSNKTFSFFFFFSCQLSLCLGIECNPPDFAAGSLPFLHCTTVTTAQSVLCKAAIVQGWCSLGVLVQCMSSCLDPQPLFPLGFENLCSAITRANKIPSKMRGKIVERVCLPKVHGPAARIVWPTLWFNFFKSRNRRTKLTRINGKENHW